MSYRGIPSSRDAGVSFFRSILDRLYRLETAPAGVFDTEIKIADVKITVVPGAGTARNVVFTNVLSGASYTIPL